LATWKDLIRWATIESLITAMNYQDVDTIEHFNVAPIRPEEVRTIEAGYRTTISDKVFVDLVVYHSWYNSFIGYKVGGTYYYETATNLVIPQKIYRVAANAVDEVTTRGVSIGATILL
jgi:outer membrane receptor protein involved in Fe transport